MNQNAWRYAAGFPYRVTGDDCYPIETTVWCRTARDARDAIAFCIDSLRCRAPMAYRVFRDGSVKRAPWLIRSNYHRGLVLGPFLTYDEAMEHTDEDTHVDELIN